MARIRQGWLGGGSDLARVREENSKLEHDTARLTARWGRVGGWLLSGAEDGVNRTEVAALWGIQRSGSDDMATKEQGR